MPALEKNHIYRSIIEGYSSEGLGVARIDGHVIHELQGDVAHGVPPFRFSGSQKPRRARMMTAAVIAQPRTRAT